MKTILCILMTFFSVSVAAQENVAPIIYTEIVSVDNVSANELFLRGRKWFAAVYNSSKSVLQMAENNVLVGNAIYAFDISVYGGLSSADMSISYLITIQCRDGRYKYTIDNIVATPDSSGWGGFGLLTTESEIAKTGMGKKQRNKVWQATKIEFDNYAYTLIESLMSAMITGTRDTSGDNW